MSLVADYGSDSEDYSEEEAHSTKTLSEQPQIGAKKEKSSGSVKFIVDLPKFDEEEEEEKPKTSDKKPGRTSLFSMLPKPKNSSAKVKTDLTPPNVPKAKAANTSTSVSDQSKPTRAQPIQSSSQKKPEKASDSVPTTFFPMDFKQKKPVQPVESENEQPIPEIVSDKPAGPELAPVEYTAASMYAYDDTNPYYYDPNAYAGYEYQDPNYYYQEEQPQEDALDEEAITQLMGRRAGRGQASAVNITTINQHDQLQDPSIPSRMSAGSSRDFNQVKGIKPSGNQKRRHNIMYLAFQAKEREDELKEFYALNKKTKKETQGKYGF